MVMSIGMVSPLDPVWSDTGARDEVIAIWFGDHAHSLVTGHHDNCVVLNAMTTSTVRREGERCRITGWTG
jgi:hypothetical protein